jgi:hypothetical protein
VKQIGVDQEKLAQLIPLSAAASGMMVGENQLKCLKEFINQAI